MRKGQPLQRVASPPTKPSGARRVGKPAQVQVAPGKARRAGGKAAMLPGGPREGACTAVWAGGGRGKAARSDACRTRGNGENPSTATVAIATAHHSAGAPPSAFRCPAPPRVPVRTRQSEVAPRRAPPSSITALWDWRKAARALPRRAPIGPPRFTLGEGEGDRFCTWHKRG